LLMMSDINNTALLFTILLWSVAIKSFSVQKLSFLF
jgi:hypothetical protein